ncbi:hypothetical protein Ae201684P_012015 [Aphanomyces euteiches]|uniref:RING-type domain-containing protein n=1 Tax=Aphanomyces euteiches TaxID=100861 RepID=A0A6G0W9P3_9STRA|nr:hypothetical protein Ae201684_017309 [Aphanomyces euteiches]KAH9081041.1 hypothetical protein Ae201684P_012015 [Aphanomyces euteiches]
MQVEERKAMPPPPSSSSSHGIHSQRNQGSSLHNDSRNNSNSSSGTSQNGLVKSSMDAHQNARESTQTMGYYQGMHSYNGHNAMPRQATCCPVCMSHSVPPNMILEPCQHQFHYQCIEVFVQNDKACPVCRAPIQRHQSIGRPQNSSMAPPSASSSNMHADYSSNPQMNYHNSPSHNTMPPSHPGANGAGAHFASVYELPPEVFLDNSFEQTAAMNTSKMRKGKWTAEEAAYCDRLIEEFKNGNLPLAEGTTLRTFLSKLLNCDPMRISKKYTGNQCIGKIIFRRKSKEPTKDEVESTRKQLAELERIYLDRERMNQQRREKRLESEVNRDRSRLLAARNLVYAANNPSNSATNSTSTPGGPSPQSYHHAPPPQPQSTLSSAKHGVVSHNSSYGDVPQSHSMPPSSSSSHHLPPSHPTKPPTAPIKEEIKMESSSKPHPDKDFPRISSVDSFSSLFPRIASLDCFTGLQSLSSSSSAAPPRPPTSQNEPSIFRSPSLECLNTIPRVSSLEQFSNFIASIPPEPRRSVSIPPPSSSSSSFSPTKGKPPVGLLDKSGPPTSFPRVASLDRLHLPRPPSLDRLPRINSTEAFLSHVPSLGNLSAFGSFSNLNSLVGKDKPHNMSRNSSIEDILSLVAASSESDQLKKRKAPDSTIPSSSSFTSDKKNRV